MYVCDRSLCVSDIVPRYVFEDPRKFPLLWIGKTECDNLTRVLYDKKGVYVKFMKNNRYYQDYMELYKYCKTDLKLEVLIHKLDGPPDLLCWYLEKYRICYGDRLILSQEYKNILCPPEFKTEVVVKPVKTQVDINRDKSRRYYQKHKESILAKRASKKMDHPAVLPNTAEQIDDPV